LVALVSVELQQVKEQWVVVVSVVRESAVMLAVEPHRIILTTLTTLIRIHQMAQWAELELAALESVELQQAPEQQVELVSVELVSAGM
jgi:hypothetical protein